MVKWPIVLLVLLFVVIPIQSYSFPSSIDNLLYIQNTSTLFVISSSHLHQLHWSTTNQTLLLLHRRVQLHSSIDNSEYGVSVFAYDSFRQLLIICARSYFGRCILYDATDISRTYLLDSSIETNSLGCFTGCFTFVSSTNIIRSALVGNRLERNGNIINSQIELGKDLLSYNIKYQLASSDNTLITSLTFLPERLDLKENYEFLYGFDDETFTYFVLKSSRIARLCQSNVVMRMTYEEIPLVPCHSNRTNRSLITAAYHSFDSRKNLFINYDDFVCIYSLDDIKSAFQSSRRQCQAGHGYRLAHIVDSVEGRPTCEKTLDTNITDVNQCNWQSHRTNTYMDGTIGAQGKKLYQTQGNGQVKIQFIFVQEQILLIGTSERKVLKFIQTNDTNLHLVHEAVYQNGPFNSQYVVDNEHQSLIFAVGSELHRYAYNSCSLYDTCRSCLASRKYDDNPCIWHNGQCSFESNRSISDRGCPPSIDHIHPLNISVNRERMKLNLIGLFEGVRADQIKVTVKFPLPNQNLFPCTIERIQNESLICDLIIPKQPVEGTISIEIKPSRLLISGDTDLSGTFEYPEKLNVYVPKPLLEPDTGPMAGGTKIRIENLDFDIQPNLFSKLKIQLGKRICSITEVADNQIECINQPCENDHEQLSMEISLNNQSWLIEPTFFQCRKNPFVTDWFPKSSILSGGLTLFVRGEHFDVVQTPMMKFFSNRSDYEFVSSCKTLNSSLMTCPSPKIAKNAAANPPVDLEISFMMDNIHLIPEENLLTVGFDPIYYPFDDEIQQVKQSNIIHFEGSNLSATDEIDVRIDQIDHACRPFNWTDKSLQCQLTEKTLRKLQTNEANVEIRVGKNLTFLLGKIFVANQTHSAIIPSITRQLVSWTLIILIVLSSVTLLTIIFLGVIFLRRYYFHSSEKYSRANKPPQFYQDVWCELGKKWQIQLKYLNIAEKIGQGCFGDVYRGELKRPDEPIVEVAVKVLREQNVASMHEFLFEANRMKEFSHPNVLSLIGVVWDPIRQAMVLLPFMKNGDLRSYISNEKNRPTVRQLITWGIQVADGMEYLSSLKFVHRDLATRNCMLDEHLICRISDFGLSRDVIDRDYYLVPRATTSKDKNGMMIQTAPRRLPIRWLSPESIESSKYTIQSDIWSYGILLWELMSRGKTPYTGIDNADIFTYVKNGYRLPQPTYCPHLLYKSAMYPCWNSDPNQRPTFTQLVHDIRHILHQLEVQQQNQQQNQNQNQHSSSVDDEDTTIVERFPADKRLKRLSTTSLSSAGSIGGQYITTPHRQSENIQLLFDRDGDDDDSYAVAVTSTAEIFSTTRLLPKYTETSISEDA